MFEVPLRDVMVKNCEMMVQVAPETTVREATRAMAQVSAGAVLVVQAEQLIGIFTERDVVYRVVARDLDPAVTPLSQVMTPTPRTLTPEQPFGMALALMHKKGFRHVPVVQDGRPLGMVLARNALDPDMEDFVAESRRRDRYVVAD